MNTFLHITIGYTVPRNHYLTSNSKILQIDHFWANLGVPKITKLVSFKCRGHKHDPRTRKEPSDRGRRTLTETQNVVQMCLIWEEKRNGIEAK